MSELTTSQSQKKLSGLCYESTVIDRKGRIRKLKPPVPLKPRALSAQPISLRDTQGQGQEIQHPNARTLPNLNARNNLEMNANDTRSAHREAQRKGEVLNNDANPIGSTEPIWQERPGAKRASEPVAGKDGGRVTTDQDVIRNRHGLVLADKMDIITDVDNYKQVLIKNAQLKFKVQKIRKQKIDRITGDDIAAADDDDDVENDADPINRQQVSLHPTQEPNRNVYELALETLENEEDDEDEDEDEEDDDEEDGGGCSSRRSESPDTLVERILENMGDDDGMVVDFDGDSAPEKPPRMRRLYNRERSFSDEILERLGGEKSPPGIAPTARILKTDDKADATGKSYKDGSGLDVRDVVWVQASEQQQPTDEVRRHSELSCAAAAAAIRLDKYIIDQQPIGDVGPKISEVEREVRKAQPTSTIAEPEISGEETKLNHVDSKIGDARPKISHAKPKIIHPKPKISHPKPKIGHVEQKNPTLESFIEELPPDVADQPTVIDAQYLSNLSQASVQPSETAIRLGDPRRSVRERSPEEIFEEIMESMRDTEGEYEDPSPLVWRRSGRAPPERIRDLGASGGSIDYCVENDWLSFFYCNRINPGSAAATPPQRRSSQGNRTPEVAPPNSTGPAADGVGIFVNASLSATSSWLARPIRGDRAKQASTSEGSEEKGDARVSLNQTEEVPSRHTEPADVVIQSRERPSTSRSTGSNSERSSVTPQNHQPDLLPNPASCLPASNLTASNLSVSNLPVSSVQSSTETLLDFAGDDQTHDQIITEVVPQSADSSRSVLQSQFTSQEQTKESSTDDKYSPVEFPDIITVTARETSAESIAQLKSLPVEDPEAVTATVGFPESIHTPTSSPVGDSEILRGTLSTGKSPESTSRLEYFPAEKPEGVSLGSRTQIETSVDDNPTDLLFAALDDAFARTTSATEVKSSTVKDNDSDDDTDNTLTPKDDVTHAVESHRDVIVKKRSLNAEPRAIGSTNRELEKEKSNEARLKDIGGVAESQKEYKQTDGEHDDVVEPRAKDETPPMDHEITEAYQLGARTKRNQDGDEQHIQDISFDVPKISGVSGAEETTAGLSDEAAEGEMDIITDGLPVDRVTVRQPHPPKRVVTVLSDEVTTQTVLLKIAWPSAKTRERSRDRSEQPFRELQLRRTMRMTEPVGDVVPQTGRQITPTPSLANQPRSTTYSGEAFNVQTVESHNNIVAKDNLVANGNPVVSDNNIANSNDIANNDPLFNDSPVAKSNDIANNNGIVNGNGALATHPHGPLSSMAMPPDFLVEYENHEQSHNTEVTSDNATVDVTQTDSVKVLLVPMETVYRVQDLKDIVAAVGRTILSDSRRIPMESNVRVTCEAVQSRSCASVQDRDVMVIKNTILDTYNSTNAAQPGHASTTAVE